MGKAQLCPVCSGSGKYQPPNDGQTTAIPMPRPCHGCGGMGWVTVDAEMIFPETHEERFIDPQLRDFYEKKAYRVTPILVVRNDDSDPDRLEMEG